MKLLDEMIKAAIEGEKIRPTLGDDVSIHVSRLICASLFDMGTAGEGILFHGGKRLGEALVQTGTVKGDNVRTILESLFEILGKLRLGIFTIVSETVNSAIVDSKECYNCAGTPFTGHGICHYDRGLLTGTLSKALNRKFTVREVKCHSKGDDCCEFEIKGI